MGTLREIKGESEGSVGGRKREVGSSKGVLGTHRDDVL